NAMTMMTRPHSWRRRLAGLIVPAVLATTGSAHAELASDPWKGLTPLSDVELAELRGGFFTVNGFEIAFAVQVRAEFGDQLVLTSWLNPIGGGGFELLFPTGSLSRDETGQVTSSGNPGVVGNGDSTSFDFGSLVAVLTETLDGFVLDATGDYPVSLTQ